MGVASVSQGLVLDSAADLVERGVGQVHHMEGVSDLCSVGHSSRLHRCRALRSQMSPLAAPRSAADSVTVLRAAPRCTP